MYEYLTDFDELNKLKRKHYDDFNRLRLRLMKESNLDVETIRRENKKMFAKMMREDDEFFLSLLAFLKENKGLDISTYNIDEFKESYNSTMKYVYNNEKERKRDRYAELLIATALSTGVASEKLNSADMMKYQKRDARYWNLMLEEIAVDLERDVYIHNWEEDGSEFVLWGAVGDEKTCAECEANDGLVFPIDDIPERHPGCRCILEPVKD